MFTVKTTIYGGFGVENDLVEGEIQELKAKIKELRYRSYLKRSRSKRSAYIKKVRHLRVKKIKDEIGGKCILCGYDKNYASLDFHHLRDKKFPVNTSSMQKPMELIEEEIKKCVLICRNCHNDIHYPHMSKYPENTLNLLSLINNELSRIS